MKIKFFKFAIAHLAVVIAWISTSCQPEKPTPTIKPVRLVRGYIAVSVGGNLDTPGAPTRIPIRDIFIPGVKVFLTNLLNGTQSEPVLTDLSGRFTLRVQNTSRYRLCWEAQGFVNNCSQDIFSVSNANVHLGTLRILPDRSNGTTIVFGQVKMKDGSPPRRLEPLANVNAFAQVALLDAGNNPLQQVYVNNFGDYLLPKVPVKQAIVLRATIEGASKEQSILPEANLGGAPLHSIDLIVGNTPPRLEPIVPFDASGRRVKVAKPGSQVQLAARSSDADGDPLKFKWMVAEGSGTVSAIDAPSITWSLPNGDGLYSIKLLAYDGKGGYAQSPLSLRADNLGIPFSGKVEGTDAPAVAGAEIEINGQTAFTGAEGFFQVRVKDANRFVMNIRKSGYALVSRIYDNSIVGGKWTMTRATVTSIDPTRDNEVADNIRFQFGTRNCPGPPSSYLNWREYPKLVQPQWQDGQSNVVAPFGELEVLLPGNRQPNRECGPVIRVRIPANSLQDARGNPPVGNVNVTVSTIDLMSPEQMPGDYTVKMPNGDTMVMQSYGAGTVEITSGTQRFNLKPGTQAEVVIPVDPSQLVAGGSLPPTMPVLFYDERQGIWIPEGDASLQGNVYVAKVKHFSAINTDLVKTNQSCVRVLSTALPPTYNLEITIPMGGGAAPQVITRLINNAPPSEHVLYNLPSNTNIVLVPIRLTDNTPIGTFVVNTGGPQNPTSPNLPAGPPYTACATQVTLADLAVPDVPVSGEFLHGLYSFEATNLDELDPADPIEDALAQALV